MILAAILGDPPRRRRALVACERSLRDALHAVTSVLTLAGALTVTVTVNRGEPWWRSTGSFAPTRSRRG